MNRVALLVSRFWPVVIALWGAAVAAAVLLPPPFEEVAAFDDAMFLPPDSAAVRAEELIASGWPDDELARSATVALIRPDEPLGPTDEDHARELVAWLESGEAPAVFEEVTTHLRDEALAEALTSDDGHVMLLAVGMATQPYAPATRDAVRGLRTHLDRQAGPEGLDVYVTGTAGVAVDENEAIQASVSRTQLLSVVLVVALLFWVFRAPLAPLIPLATVGAAYLVSLGTVTTLAGAGLDVTYLYGAFAIVIVFGAGTDYCLLIMSRFGEELRLGRRAGIEDGQLRRATLVATMAVLGGVMASSAASTIVGFSAQSFAQFGLFRTMGPALAVTVAITFAAGLTLTPALVRGFGRSLFWPSATGRGPTGEGTPLVAQAGAEPARPRTGTETP